MHYTQVIELSQCKIQIGKVSKNMCRLGTLVSRAETGGIFRNRLSDMPYPNRNRLPASLISSMGGHVSVNIHVCILLKLFTQ